MDNKFTYLLILAVSLAGPLALSFDRKVAFYRKWKFAFLAMIAPALFYIIWDIIFTSRGVWSFNEMFVTGTYVFNLPVEEVLFFIVVPYCCTFIYECVKIYFSRLRTTLFSDRILIVIAIILFVTGTISYGRDYTFYSFIFCALFIFLLLLFKKYFVSLNKTAFLVSYSLILLPFLAVNGFLTALPVVSYDDAENLGIRIYTIPVEDIFYGMMLVMMNITIYEKLQRQM